MAQLHKKFTDEQLKDLFKRYLQKEIPRKYLLEILGIKKSCFAVLLKQYKLNPYKFSIQYRRRKNTRAINPEVEKNIIRELEFEQRLIKNKEVNIITTALLKSN